MRTRRIAFVSVLAACAAAIPAAPAMAGGDVTVMTRNLYLGADIITLAGADKSTDQFKRDASAMWKKVQKTNFPKRAPALAKEIKAAKPDLVGLQEASLWRTGPNSSAPATKVKYDFTAELLKALKKQGLEYKIVVTQNEFDFEAPTVGTDVRLTQRDVILKRKSGSKVTTGATSKGQYSLANTLVVPTAVGPATSVRGWVAVDAAIGGTAFKFVNTHFEAYGDSLRAGQASELVGPGGPLADAAKPSILLGDFNSGPAQAGAPGNAYRNVIGAGFNNIWGTQTDVRTIGRDEMLDKQSDTAFIDQVTYRPLANFSVATKKVVGNSPFSKSIPKWSSDHNGVVARLTVK